MSPSVRQQPVMDQTRPALRRPLKLVRPSRVATRDRASSLANSGTRAKRSFGVSEYGDLTVLKDPSDRGLVRSSRLGYTAGDSVSSTRTEPKPTNCGLWLGWNR
jgi:hypothetical protein